MRAIAGSDWEVRLRVRLEGAIGGCDGRVRLEGAIGGATAGYGEEG